MTKLHPHVRVHARNGVALLRDGLSLSFYMHRSHQEMPTKVLRALNTYLRAVGPESLTWYADLEGEWQELDAHEREVQLKHLLEARSIHLIWKDEPGGAGDYQIEYWGRWLENPHQPRESGMVSMLWFWLPTEFLEKHGPGQVRELAMDLAEPLPFNSGSAGLSFNALSGFTGFSPQTRALCFRHPGMRVHDDFTNVDIGTRVSGVNWLTFLGQPVLGKLGGATGLRTRLNSPGTTVQSMEGDRAVVTLGAWPEAGDLEAGNVLPAYRELTSVLEPWLYEPPPWKPELRRWERRFLD